MTWFKVSDDLHSHPKALAAGPAALGLWTLAGSWSSANGTGGFVPGHVLPRLSEDPAPLARKLVAAGLWRRVRDGYEFHEWDERNPSAKTAKILRSVRSVNARNANHKRWHVDRGVVEPGCEFCASDKPP